MWSTFIRLRIGTSEHGNESSGFIKCWEILEQLSDWQLLKMDSQFHAVMQFIDSPPLVSSTVFSSQNQ
jgi:hypothetical protein